MIREERDRRWEMKSRMETMGMKQMRKRRKMKIERREEMRRR